MSQSPTSTTTSRRPVKRHSRSDMPTVGDVVTDPDMDSDDTLVVVRVHETRADNYEIDDLDETVASYSANASYPDDTYVVEIAFLNALQESYARENIDTVAELCEYLEDGGFQLYPYPVARLGNADASEIISADTQSRTTDNAESDGVTNADDLLEKAMGTYETSS